MKEKVINKKKKKSIENNKIIESISFALKSGYSIEDICHKYKIERNKVVFISDEIVENVKKDAPKQRILFRQSVRDTMVAAKNFLHDVINGKHDFEPEKLTNLKMQAAKNILSFGQKYTIEDPMMWLSESIEDEEDQYKNPTFIIDVDESGKTNHVVEYSSDKNKNKIKI